MPFLIFAAPFIIMRNTIRGRRIEGRNFGFAMMAAVLAGFWSLMSGTVVVMALRSDRPSASRKRLASSPLEHGKVVAPSEERANADLSNSTDRRRNFRPTAATGWPRPRC